MDHGLRGFVCIFGERRCSCLQRRQRYEGRRVEQNSNDTLIRGFTDDVSKFGRRELQVQSGFYHVFFLFWAAIELATTA